MNYDHYYLVIEESDANLFEELFEINDFNDYYIQNNLESQFISLNIYLEENKEVPDFLKRYELIKKETSNLEEWQKKWKESLKEFYLCDGIKILPLHEKKRITENHKIGIIPGFLFGTGLHESTRLASSLLKENINEGESVLDVGCGTGILSVLAKKTGADYVLGVDIEKNTQEKVEEICWINDIEFDFRESDFLGNIQKEEKFDIIVSNMIIQLINKFVLKLGDFLKEDGKIIITGILEEQSKDFEKIVEEKYNIIERKVENEWIGFLLKIKK